ncbi:MAG: hypothetical protein Q4C88_06030 [Akkermansia sp.]|nr:hypothetical protein [Akkermansia sp.]
MKRKQITETISTALKSVDTTHPIIGRDAYAPKNGNGTAAKKTLTALVKQAQEAAAEAKEHRGEAQHHRCAAELCERDTSKDRLAAHDSARTAKWCAAIAAASAIISIITAAL